ncbi:lysoplasmalogenase [Pseudoalteromonas tunicata]|uniref:lysoplasmalogenase n=1 Tax=Pseudoalteromonas tunicata TaxID=314281 RepID=UPI00273F05C1|nr:lysoplasmalogenase [Pseudoalteromonas tunicata]MDP4983635.1 lysoplasmalogenase [Pseudoalteromonas tunicata]
MILYFILTTILAVIHIWADHKSYWKLCYIFKPLTTLSIIALALSLYNSAQPLTLLVLVALGFSLLGDIFLMLKSDRFLAGLQSFFAAHLCYIAWFTTNTSLTLEFYFIIPLLIIGSVYMSQVWPKAGSLKWAVLAYGSLLQLMVIAASSFYFAFESTTAGRMALIGAVLFMFSDSVLGFSRFVKNWRYSHGVVLVSYYLAQTLLVLSLLPY